MYDAPNPGYPRDKPGQESPDKAALIKLLLVMIGLMGLPGSILGPTAAAAGATSVPTPSGSYTLTVPADRIWPSSGVVVANGDTVAITATGEWDPDINVGSPNGPAGTSPPPCTGRPYLDRNAACESLIAKLGPGSPFEVGTQLRFVVQLESPEELYFSINDTSCCFDDNSGSLTVRVSVVVPALVVNGFKTTTAQDPYSTAMRQMINVLPSHAVVHFLGVPVCVLTANSANEVYGRDGVELVWDVAPTKQYLSQDPQGQNLERPVRRPVLGQFAHKQ